MGIDARVWTVRLGQSSGVRGVFCVKFSVVNECAHPVCTLNDTIPAGKHSAEGGGETAALPVFTGIVDLVRLKRRVPLPLYHRRDYRQV